MHLSCVNGIFSKSSQNYGAFRQINCSTNGDIFDRLAHAYHTEIDAIQIVIFFAILKNELQYK